MTIMEKATAQKFEKIVVSYPFPEIEVFFNSINYKRLHPEIEVDIHELEDIFSWTQKQIFLRVAWDVESHTGRRFSDFQVILSEILSIKVDSEPLLRILDEKWSFVKSEIRNIFIPKERYDFLEKLCHTNLKTLSHILPSEYCILDIFDEELCAIDLWESSTSISLKKKWGYRKIIKIPIWTWKLIEKIKKTSSYSRSQIIEFLRDSSEFRNEKEAFIKIWISSLCYTLSDLLDGEICPNSFYLYGGGMNNNFVKKALLETDYHKHRIKMLWKIEILSENMGPVLAHIEHISLEDISKIPLHMYALLLEMRKIISRESDIIAKSLKHATRQLRSR